MESFIGGILFLMMVIGIGYYSIPSDETLSATASIEKAVESNIRGSKRTILDIFDIMKKQVLSFDMFNSMLEVAGVDKIPKAPDGWAYEDSSEGRKLIPDYLAEEWVWTIALKSGGTITRDDCAMKNDGITILCGNEVFKDYEWFSQKSLNDLE